MADITKIVLVIGFLLFLIKKKWDLGLVLFIGTLCIGIGFGLNPGVFFKGVGEALVSQETLSLMGIIVLVLYLGLFLERRGSFKTMVDSLKGLIPEPRLILAVSPAFVGLLPMLGGALLSAPIVEEAGKRWNLSPPIKTFLNYWFRHIWEYSWPLYLNLILASSILQIPIKRISAVQFPFTLLAAGLGFFLLFKHVGPLPREGNDRDVFRNSMILLMSIWPILGVILLIFVLKLSMILSLAVVALLINIVSRMTVKDRWQLVWRSFSPRTLFLLAAVMVFKRILEDSGALQSVTRIFPPEGVPGYFLLFAAPFFLGLLTGVNHAFVGISFPLLLPVFGTPQPDMVLVLFAYVSGFVGILLSPAHLCLSLTVDYFRANLKDVYQILIWPSLAIFGAALIVLVVMRIL